MMHWAQNHVHVQGVARDLPRVELWSPRLDPNLWTVFQVARWDPQRRGAFQIMPTLVRGDRHEALLCAPIYSEFFRAPGPISDDESGWIRIDWPCFDPKESQFVLAIESHGSPEQFFSLRLGFSQLHLPAQPMLRDGL